MPSLWSQMKRTMLETSASARAQVAELEGSSTDVAGQG